MLGIGFLSKQKQQRILSHSDGRETQPGIQADLQGDHGLLLEGQTAYQNRDYERAVQFFLKAVSINSCDASAYLSLGMTFRALRRLEDALLSYDKAIAIHPDYGQVHYERGVVLSELNRFEDAVASYDHAISLRPGHDVFFARANALRDLGRLEEAVKSHEEAIGLKPDFAESYSNRGNVLARLGRFEEAIVSYDRAIAIKPDFPSVYANRGVALYSLKRFEEALESYDRAISLKPDFAAAHSNRGNALCELKRAEEALVSYDKAIALQPDCADIYFNRGRVLRKFNRADDALADYRKAIALKPDFADAYDNLGQLFNELGRLNEARAAFIKAIEIDPKNVNAYYDLTESKRFAAGDPHLAAMQILATLPEALSETARIQLDFALGKAFADLGDYRRSFQHLLVANARKRAAIDYDEKAMLAQFDHIEALLTRDLIEAKSGGGHPSPRPIFIIGMPRSGTTLIEQILATHPLVHGAGELESWSEVLQSIPRRGDVQTLYPDLLFELDRNAFADIGARYLSGLAQHAAGSEYVTDKMPSNFVLVALIHLALPNAKIIHAIRDPLDTCFSCFSKLFTVGHDYTYELGELGRYYNRYQRLMEHWHRVLPPDRILEVQYEDLVVDTERQARRILSYCGLAWDERCLAFHETNRLVRTASATQVRQPIYQSAVGRWRHYREFLGPLLKAFTRSC